MKRSKTISILLILLSLTFVLTTCGTGTSEQNDMPEIQNGTDITNKADDSIPAPDISDSTEDGAKILVAYFSCTGNTSVLAEYAAESLHADLFEIVPETPYTDDDLNYSNSDSRTSIEQNDESARPAIAGSVENMEEYDIVFLGYPIWWGQAPKIISTFLESYSFDGKTIVPFCTSGSSGIGSSGSNLHGLTSEDVTWLAGDRLPSDTSKEEMAEWIQNLKGLQHE